MNSKSWITQIGWGKLSSMIKEMIVISINKYKIKYFNYIGKSDLITCNVCKVYRVIAGHEQFSKSAYVKINILTSSFCFRKYKLEKQPNAVENA